MGNPRIYYYPDPVGSREDIDFGEAMSDIQRLPPRHNTVVHSSLAGGWSSADYGASQRYRLVLERIGEGAVQRALENFERHLLRGGKFGFAIDSDKAWAGFAAIQPRRGDSTLTTGGRHFYNIAATLAADDIVVVQSQIPESNWEMLLIDSATDTLVTLDASNTVVYDHNTTPILVRHRDFYPVLRLDPSMLGARIMAHEHRLVHTFDAVFVEDWETLMWLEDAPPGTMTGTTLTDGTITLGGAFGLVEERLNIPTSLEP